MMKEEYSFLEFMNIIRQLRGVNGCPWDKAQTHESLRACMLEEAYEVVDAVDNQNIDNLKEELGDLLLQVALHSVISEENKEFTIDEVVTEVSLKMIRRHPHVFGDVKVDGTEGISKNWDEIKRQEHNETSVSESMLRVPKVLPAAIKAQKVQKKAAKAGVELESVSSVLSILTNQLSDLAKISKNVEQKELEEKYEKFLFSVINLARFLGLNAENSLTNAVDKFINRFVGMERIANSEGKRLSELTTDEVEKLWK